MNSVGNEFKTAQRLDNIYDAEVSSHFHRVSGVLIAGLSKSAVPGVAKPTGGGWATPPVSSKQNYTPRAVQHRKKSMQVYTAHTAHSTQHCTMGFLDDCVGYPKVQRLLCNSLITD